MTKRGDYDDGVYFTGYLVLVEVLIILGGAIAVLLVLR